MSETKVEEALAALLRHGQVGCSPATVKLAQEARVEAQTLVTDIAALLAAYRKGDRFAGDLLWSMDRDRTHPGTTLLAEHEAKVSTLQSRVAELERENNDLRLSDREYVDERAEHIITLTSERDALSAPAAETTPEPRVLHCPECGVQHIDGPDGKGTDWSTRPHHKHLCEKCGHIWQPFPHDTVGVASPPAETTPAPNSPAAPDGLPAEPESGAYTLPTHRMLSVLAVRPPVPPVPPVDLLHPAGKCACAGEGKCEWCRTHCNDCGAFMPERDPYLVRVTEFHDAMDLPVRVAPDVGTDEERVLGVMLILEEAFEFAKACAVRVELNGFRIKGTGELTILTDPGAKPDLVAMTHELGDCQVVVTGRAVQFGLPLLAAVSEEIHPANLRKRGPDGRVVRNAQGKVLKPAGWKPANVARLLAPWCEDGEHAWDTEDGELPSAPTPTRCIRCPAEARPMATVVLSDQEPES